MNHRRSRGGYHSLLALGTLFALLPPACTRGAAAGPHDGFEIALLLARHGNDRELVPVAASATLVTATGTLPSEPAF
ncbi:MAG TPA: hypothetical protein VMT45_10535 [Thermoanaerobaculaceae bacterium]|nr:hypothetical protein [Thermoanaerobaculaceae bacterium]